jgi:hypothetical protein
MTQNYKGILTALWQCVFYKMNFFEIILVQAIGFTNDTDEFLAETQRTQRL